MKKKIKICCISDCHGNLDLSIPESDLLLIAGDLCPATHSSYTSILIQKEWLEKKFKKWIDEQPVEHVIVIAGNHCWIWETRKDEVPKWFPINCNDLKMMSYNKVEYIEDFLTFYKGLTIYGTPWQPPFQDWAFNKEEDRLELYWENIPEDTDILLCHSPPYGIMDKVEYDNFTKHIGSISLLKRIKKIRPKYVIFGHNHNQHGIIEKDDITFINCSLLDEEYKMVKKPILIEIED